MYNVGRFDLRTAYTREGMEVNGYCNKKSVAVLKPAYVYNTVSGI